MRNIVILISILLIFAGFAHAEAQIPDDSAQNYAVSRISIIPTDSWAYNSFEIAGLYMPPNFFENQRPFWYQYLESYVEHTQTNIANPVAQWELQKLHSELFLWGDRPITNVSSVPLWLKVTPYTIDRFIKKQDPLFRAGFKGEAAVNFYDKFFFQLRGRLENKGQLDSFARVRRWKDKFTGYFDYALLGYKFKKFRFTLGRTFRAWGPQDNDRLLISTNSPAFDQVSMEFEGKSVAFQFWATKLDRFFDSQGNSLNRFFSAHRLAFKPYRGLEIGLSETVLYARKESGWELYYLNPILPYYWEQYNNLIDDNIYWGLDFSWYPMMGMKLYGELLIDDFQIDFISEAQQIGFNIGILELGRLFSKYLQVEVNYTQIRNTVYGQNKIYNIFTHDGVIIGSSLGTDADRLRYALTYHAAPYLSISAGGEIRRKGEGNIYDTENYPAPKGQKFPTGIVEKTYDNYLQAYVLYGTNIEGRVTVGYEKIKNVNHHAGDFDSPYISVNLLYHFKIFFLL